LKHLGVGIGGNVVKSGEHGILQKLKELNLTQYSIFDVGAHKGDWSQQTLDFFAGKHKLVIHAFEPAESTFNSLRNNLKDEPHVIINHMGLGKEAGEMDLFYAGEPGTIASLTQRNVAHKGYEFNTSEQVRIDTLDHYCQTHSIENIDLLKMDVEGHELDVLKGSSRMIEEHRIKLVGFEFGPCNVDTRTFFKDYFYFFKERDFTIHRITRPGYLYPITVYREICEQFRTTNFLAIRNDLL
jgi:FkbM family methyltransferase